MSRVIVIRMDEAKVGPLMDQFVARVAGVARLTEDSDGDTKRVGVVAVFRHKANKLQVLITKRKYDPQAGKWALPGGHCKQGESTEDGAQREIKEEVGLDVSNLKKLVTREGDTNETVTIYGTLYTGSDKPEADDETADVKWADVDNLPKGLAWDNNELIPKFAKDMALTEAYCGFNAQELNSNQPLPAKRVSVYRTMHEPWALEGAREMRQKYGINVWVDGTVTTGWGIYVHAGDGDRARRMFLSLLPLGNSVGLIPGVHEAGPVDIRKFINQQPQFRFLHDQYHGEQVFIEKKREGFWPQPIGAVCRDPDGNWFIVSGRVMGTEWMWWDNEFGRGEQGGVHGPRWADKGEAATQLWLSFKAAQKKRAQKKRAQKVG